MGVSLSDISCFSVETIQFEHPNNPRALFASESQKFGSFFFLKKSIFSEITVSNSPFTGMNILEV